MEAVVYNPARKSGRGRDEQSGNRARRRHGELEAGGNCGVGGNGGSVGDEGETSGGGAGGKRGIGGAGVRVSGSVCADSRRAAVVCAAGDAVSGSRNQDRQQDRRVGGKARGASV